MQDFLSCCMIPFQRHLAWEVLYLEQERDRLHKLMESPEETYVLWACLQSNISLPSSLCRVLAFLIHEKNKQRHLFPDDWGFLRLVSLSAFVLLSNYEIKNLRICSIWIETIFFLFWSKNQKYIWKILIKILISEMNVFGHIIEGNLEVKLPTIWIDEK